MTTTKKSSFFRRDDSNPATTATPADNQKDRAPRAPRAPRTPRRDDDRPARSAAPARSPRTPKPDWIKGDKPKFERSGDKPKFERGGDKPKFERSGDKPKFERSTEKRAPRPTTATTTKGKPTTLKLATTKVTTGKPAVKPAADGPIRLNRFVAQSGVCSRREADQLIANGEILVNNVVITELGSKVDPRTDAVVYDGRKLSGEKFVYIIMNKPKGYVTSTDDPHNEDTVISLLKGQVKERVYPVGRLDKNTTGVLLLTNDGDLTKTLTHPSYERRKIYHVFLDKPCTEEHLEMISKGIELEDGEIHADEVSYVEGNRKEVGIEIHCGRNRIVRRIFEHLGYEVIKLDRVFFAGFTKVGLRRGFWRLLTPKEVMALKNNQ